MSWGCITCEVFQRFDAVGNTYAREAFASVTPFVKGGFFAFVGLWVAWQLLRISTADIDFRGLGWNAAALVFAGAALSGTDFYWSWVYEPTRAAMSGLTQMMVKNPSTGVADTSMTGLLQAVEGEILKVFATSKAMMEGGGMFTFLPYIAALILMIPYVFVWCIFLAYLLEGIFKLLAITALAPVFIAIAPFRSTRGFSMSALRVMVGGVLTVVFAGVAMGFTITVVKYYTGQLPLSAEAFTSDADDFIFSPDYFAILLIGFVSILLHLKAATLAANIAGANDGPGAAAGVAAAGLAVAGVPMAMAKAGAIAGGMRTARGVGKGTASVARLTAERLSKMRIGGTGTATPAASSTDY
jgi:hypothetical protein